jgi:membrane-associated protein
MLERHGGPLIFGARFVPGGRTATTVSAGALRMRWARFAAFAAMAALGWASYAALMGYIGGRAFEDNPLWGLLVGFGLAALTFLAVEVARRVRARSRPADVIDAVAEEPARPDRKAA